MLVESALGVVSNVQLRVLPDVYLVCAVCSFRITQSTGSLGVANLTRLQVHRAGAAPFKTANNLLRNSQMSSKNSVRTGHSCSNYATLRRFRVSRGVRKTVARRADAQGRASEGGYNLGAVAHAPVLVSTVLRRPRTGSSKGLLAQRSKGHLGDNLVVGWARPDLLTLLSDKFKRGLGLIYGVRPNTTLRNEKRRSPGQGRKARGSGALPSSRALALRGRVERSQRKRPSTTHRRDAGGVTRRESSASDWVSVLSLAIGFSHNIMRLPTIKSNSHLESPLFLVGGDQTTQSQLRYDN
ncbi:uncharacterized protein CC84DRAFT_630390 [Paraphaeosphaeria sporulosa]|uniref:Uncharacterized protein n=1 Tax=Paraphaeosphaeria sporulosa TaxID=1460663 RepID=A0A177CH50_9PLEO|nr:uncharacterized protein CC84DRAFT_630390 [Paraphaeosphaeria sporulosa]OAG06894.1 hypothetical protein CC84DRAFT_630390 [Paraphaeosphaeria sporulosa]